MSAGGDPSMSMAMYMSIIYVTYHRRSVGWVRCIGEEVV
jgi:hypothetical protein